MTITRRNHIVILLVLVAITFANSLWNGFVWDDFHYLINNRVFRDFDLRRILLSPATGLEYFPVRDLSFALDVQLWGKNPFGFHLTSLLLYMANVVMVYLFTIELCQAIVTGNGSSRSTGLEIAFMASLLFAVHPIHCESVNWISSRGSLFTGLFFFASLFFYLRFLNREAESSAWRCWVLSLACYVMAILSKQYGIILPLVLLVVPLTLNRRKVKARLLGMVPFFLTAIVGFLMHRQIAVDVNLMDKAVNYKPSEVLAQAVQIPFFYFWKLLAFWSGYAAEYNVNFSRTMGDVKSISAIGCLLLTCSAVFLLRKKFIPVYFAFAWFIITLLPFLNYYSTHPVISDRYAYLPSYAFCFLAAAGISYAYSRFGGIPWQTPCLLILVSAMALVSIRQNKVWASDGLLWSHAVQISPSGYACTNLGVYYFDEKRYADAFKLFSQARELEKGNHYFDYYQGVLELNNGKLESAATKFSALLAIQPDFYKASGQLGFALDMLGRKQEAIGHYRKALQVRGKKWEIAYNAANILLSQKDYAGAAKYYAMSLDINPENPEAYNNLGTTYKLSGNYPMAIKSFEKAAEIDPKHAYAYFNLAETHYLAGNKETARGIFVKTAARFPDLRSRIEPYLNESR